MLLASSKIVPLLALYDSEATCGENRPIQKSSMGLLLQRSASMYY